MEQRKTDHTLMKPQFKYKWDDIDNSYEKFVPKINEKYNQIVPMQREILMAKK